jgi:alpha-1,3-rhamnosyl/mannosyltransferase
MRIIVNAAPLRNMDTGIGRYIRELYAHIQALRPGIEIGFFNGKGVSGKMPPPAGESSFRSRAIDLAWRMPSLVPYAARVISHERSSRAFRRLCRGYDIYHEAGFFPLETTGSVKTVFTIHDLSLEVHPEFHPRDRVLFSRKYFRTSLDRADALITPSDFTRKEIERVHPSVAVNIHPIHLGVNPSVFFPHAKDEVDAFKTKHRLPERYVLFAATADPRKNMKTLLAALERLPASIALVCTGWSGWGRKEKKGMPAGMRNRVLFTGYVSDAELALLYSGGRLFAYPSFYEGFGLPVLEAMACGCPVLCSDAASLPEVCEDAALYCPPDDAACMADVISEVFSSDKLYKAMKKKGLQQAKKFRWMISAAETVQVFEGLI